MAIDLQRRYRYNLSIIINATDTSHDALVDEFTPPEVRRESIISQNQKMGQITLVGPATYGEMTLRVALRVGTDAETTASQSLIDDLESLNDRNINTCNVILSNKYSNAGSEDVSYTQTYENCKLLSYKLDPVSRKDDSEFLHIEMVLVPTRTTKVKVA